MTDQEYMDEAVRQAIAAGDRGECPVGAVLVKDGVVVARAGNEELAARDATAHAEMLCLRQAGEVLGTHVLDGCTMYTTLWPCPMCHAAMLQAQVSRVVAGCTTFRWILEVRFRAANLEMVGPIRQRQCRDIFIDWATRNKRREILDLEDDDPS